MSAPTSVWVVFSHLTCGLARSIGLAPYCSVSPVPNTAFRLPVTIGLPGYAPILSLPVSPQLARSFRAENGPFPLRNGSSFKFHATANDGHGPYRLSGPNSDDASLRLAP